MTVTEGFLVFRTIDQQCETGIALNISHSLCSFCAAVGLIIGFAHYIEAQFITET